MNFQQLEYILALDEQRSFVRAAEQCFVTQATLSMMVKKLEEELGVVLFDRSKQPVRPTAIGEQILQQARRILREAKHLQTLVAEHRGQPSGELRLGIIPTLAPYVLPLFIQEFLQRQPRVKVIINELTTEEIIRRLEAEQLDVGLLATPLHRDNLTEIPLFEEEFLVYANPKEGLNQDKKYILAQDLSPEKLWLLEEGHCLRAQVVNLCALQAAQQVKQQLYYEAGSIDALKRLVDNYQGFTILPELAALNLSEVERQRLFYFKPPVPVREISLVVYRQQMQAELIESLAQVIREKVQVFLQQKISKKILEL